jgi:hypothetical protein
MVVAQVRRRQVGRDRLADAIVVYLDLVLSRPPRATDQSAGAQGGQRRLVGGVRPQHPAGVCYADRPAGHGENLYQTAG